MQAIRNRKKWNTQIVSTEWLQDSVRQELAQPEDRYLPESLRQEVRPIVEVQVYPLLWGSQNFVAEDPAFAD